MRHTTVSFNQTDIRFAGPLFSDSLEPPDVLSYVKPSSAPKAIITTNSDHETYNDLADATADQLEAELSLSESREDVLLISTKIDEYRTVN